PTLLATVEFDEPALPWLFTPAAAAADRLAPWMVLVVVPAEAATLNLDPGRPLPVLTLPADAGTQLPALGQSWAWAHAQLTGDGDPPAQLGQPGQAAAALARLVCPRRLAGDTRYPAAGDPAYLQGVQAGLGQPVDAGALQPAWTSGTVYLDLPVYHSW